MVRRGGLGTRVPEGALDERFLEIKFLENAGSPPGLDGPARDDLSRPSAMERICGSLESTLLQTPSSCPGLLAPDQASRKVPGPLEEPSHTPLA